MHDKTCFFGCKRYWECPEGKPNKTVRCNRRIPVEGYEPEEEEVQNTIDWEKLNEGFRIYD